MRDQVITLGSLGARVHELVDRARRLVHRYEPVSRVINHVNTLEAFDLSLILAAQAFLTIVPLLIVLAAFAPRLLGVPMSNELQAVARAQQQLTRVPRHARGPRPRCPGGRSAWLRTGRVGGPVHRERAAAWLRADLEPAQARLAALRLAIDGLARRLRPCLWAVRTGCFRGQRTCRAATQLLLLIALGGAFLFWWWTPHLLLAGQIGWRALLPSAALTGGVLVALLWISPLLMPGFVASSEYEFGPLGTVFVVMLWLTIVCSIVVFCAIAGQVIATGPRLSRLLHLTPQPGHGPGHPDGLTAREPGSRDYRTTGTIETTGNIETIGLPGLPGLLTLPELQGYRGEIEHRSWRRHRQRLPRRPRHQRPRHATAPPEPSTPTAPPPTAPEASGPTAPPGSQTPIRHPAAIPPAGDIRRALR